MKHYYFILLWCWLGLSACHTTKEVVTVRETVHDTPYREAIRYDSVFIDRNTTTERRGDTVFRDRVLTDYRWRYLHDTTYVARRDTIPVVTYVDKPTPYVPRMVLALAWLGCGCIIILILKLLWKIRTSPSIFRSQSLSAVRLLRPIIS